MPLPAPQRRAWWVAKSRACVLLLALALSGCASLLGPAPPTPFPTEYLPTVIALTLQAGGLVQPGAGPEDTARAPAATAEAGVAETATPLPTPIPSPTLQPPVSSPNTVSGPSVTPYTLEPSITPTTTPEIPNAEIEIRNLGAFSRVTSPLHIYGYLRPGAGGKVRIELLGEDRRLLARQIKLIDFIAPGAWSLLSADLDFEIAATAESGRLQISVDDEYGRIVALNSVPLILLSIGDADTTYVSRPAS